MRKDRVSRFLAQELRVMNKRADKSDNEVTLESMVSVLRTFLHSHWSQIMSAFYYFCSLDENEIFRMKLNSYTVFTDDAGIHDKDNKFSNRSELDTLFIVTNYVDRSEKEDAKAGQDLGVALTVAEFMEILLRIAQAKFVKTGLVTSLADALEMLFTDCIQAHLPKRLWEEPNLVRSEDLYREEIDDSLKKHEHFLRILFNSYRFRMENGKRPNRMRIDTAFKQFLFEFDLIGERLGIRDGLYMAITSRMEVDDIIGKWDKNRSMNFLDFAETLCRVAHQLRLPSQSELAEHKYTNVWSYFIDMKNKAVFGRAGDGPDMMSYTDDKTMLNPTDDTIDLSEEGTVIVGSVQKKQGTGVVTKELSTESKFILANQVHALVDLIARQVILKYPGDRDRSAWIEDFGIEHNAMIIAEATSIMRRLEKKL